MRTFARGESVHSGSVHSPPLPSTVMMTGASPWCDSCQASAACVAAPWLNHWSGEPGMPGMRTRTGSCGRGSEYQAGGRYTLAGRAWKPEAVFAGSSVVTVPYRGSPRRGCQSATGTVRPAGGRSPAATSVYVVAGSSDSVSG